MINIEHWAENNYSECKQKPAILYKITDCSLESLERLQWGVNQTRYLPPQSSKTMTLEECEAWFKNPKPYGKIIFAYTHPVLASLLYRSVHGPQGLRDPMMWEATGNVKYMTVDGVALCSELTTLRRVPTPQVSMFGRMKFGFGCVSKVYKDELYRDWILDWISEKDRSADKAKKMATYCAVAFEKQNGVKSFDLNGQAAWAAQWMCWAATAYDTDNSNKTIEFWISQAASEAAKVAHRANLKDFNLQTIAEITLSAR